MGRETIEPLGCAEQWLRDGLAAVDIAGAFGTLDVDMSECREVIVRLKSQGVRLTYTTLIVKAAALALLRFPELHKLVAGNKRLIPENVDICVSISDDSVVTPVVIIENAGRKSALEIAADIRDKAPVARADNERLIKALCRWGWLVPFSALRRAIVHRLLQKLWYRRKVSGTFQISVVQDVDCMVPLLFNTAAALGVGRVRQRAVVRDGRIEAALVVTLACCIDHKIWNGLDLAKFLNAVKSILETETQNAFIDSPTMTPTTN